MTNERETKMNKSEAISNIARLDQLMGKANEESRFWRREYYLAGTASKYVRASEKLSIENRIHEADQKEDGYWNQITELMETFKIELSELNI